MAGVLETAAVRREEGAVVEDVAQQGSSVVEVVTDGWKGAVVAYWT